MELIMSTSQLLNSVVIDAVDIWAAMVKVANWRKRRDEEAGRVEKTGEKFLLFSVC